MDETIRYFDPIDDSCILFEHKEDVERLLKN